MKEITVVQKDKLGFTSHLPYAIVSSGFSGRHLYATSKKLCQEIKSLEIPDLTVPTVHGRRDDSWMLVVCKDIQVHLVLADYRNELDLEFRWLNKPPEEIEHKRRTYEKMKKKGDQLDINNPAFWPKDDPDDESKL